MNESFEVKTFIQLITSKAIDRKNTQKYIDTYPSSHTTSKR